MSAPPRPRRLPTLVLVALAAVVVAGCQVRTDVELVVDRDGSGSVAVTVTLDREAAAQVPNLAAQLRVEDLRRAGWRLSAPRRTATGGIVISASKPFGRAEQAGAVLDELAGKGGPFRGFEVSRSHSFARTSWAARGTVDLQRGLASFSDRRITALLGGRPFGRSEAELRLLAHGSLAAAAPFRIRVRLPTGEHRTYAVRLGDRPRSIDARAAENETNAYLLAGAAAVALVAAIVLYLLGGRRRRKPPRSQRGMGTYDRRRFQPLGGAEQGPPPGTGGVPELVQVRRQPQPPPDRAAPPPRARIEAQPPKRDETPAKRPPAPRQARPAPPAKRSEGTTDRRPPGPRPQGPPGS